MKLISLAIAAAAAAGTIALAAPAHADYLFNICPSGRSGVASTVTSCQFADNVRNAYYSQGPSLIAYSPVTGMTYSMNCAPNVATFVTGMVLNTELCYGGSDARVVVW
jgi:hypothetical protein